MNADWLTKKLGEVAVFQKGKMMPNSSIKQGSASPYIVINDLRTNKYSRFTEVNNGTACQPSDTLIVWDGANAGTVGGGLKGYVGSTITKISPKNKIDPQFLRLLLSSKFEEFNKQTHGAAIPHLNKEFILNYPIPLPLLVVQKQIIERMDKIAEAQKLNDTLIKKAGELFQSLLHQELNPTGKNWEIKKLGEICTFQYGYTQSAKDNGSYRFIRITDIDESGEIRDDDKKYISDKFKMVKSYILKEGDLLVARTGATYGKILIFHLDIPSVYASYLIRIQPDTSKVVPKFIWLFSRSKGYWRQASRLVNGSGQPQFNANKIKEIKIKLPNIKYQQKIINRLETLQEYKKKLLKEKILLKELFDSVLDRCMKGEI